MKKLLFLSFLFSTSFSHYVADFDISMQLKRFANKLPTPASHRIYAYFKTIYNNFADVNSLKTNNYIVPPILHYIWLGSTLPTEYERYKQSWLEHHSNWTFIFYTDKSEYFDGTEVTSLEKLQKILSKKQNSQNYFVVDVRKFNFVNKDLFNKVNNYGSKSDILRWSMVYEFGGVYVDTDFECLGSLDILNKTYDLYTGLQPLDTDCLQLGAAIFGAKPKHLVLKLCQDELRNSIDEPKIVVATGPIHFTKCFVKGACKQNNKDIAFPATYFYPCEYLQKGTSNFEWFYKESYAVHHWEGSWLLPQAVVKHLNGASRKALQCRSPAFAQSQNGFVLLTFLYNETNPERIKEYSECLEKNLAHTDIGAIHVLYDTTKDTQTGPHIIRDFLKKHSEITVEYTTGRPRYGECFELANKKYPNKTILLSNADIYFDGTLEQLKDCKLEKQMIALTRWDVNPGGSLQLLYVNNEPALFSQDVWIFKTPIERFNGDELQLGVPYCDGQIAHFAKQAGYKLWNPCKTIHACHLHQSGIRHYERKAPKGAKLLGLPWITYGTMQQLQPHVVQ